jgi:hypothetical protein
MPELGWRRSVSAHGVVTWSGNVRGLRAERNTFVDGRMTYYIDDGTGAMRNVAEWEWITRERIDVAVRCARAGVLLAVGVRDVDKEQRA